MSVISVQNAAGLTAALVSAKNGDTINLSSGEYGDFVINSKAFSGAGVTISSEDAENAAVFNTLKVNYSSGIHFVSVNVDYTATMATYAFSSVIDINRSTDISFTGGEVTATSAINGVKADAKDLDASGNVVGLQTGRGFTIQNSSNVSVEGVDIHHVAKGVVMSAAHHVTLRGNEISDVRTSPIVGAGLSYVVIDGNHLSDSNPWGWGDAAKDHGDFIHLWTAAGAKIPSVGIEIVNNTIDQGSGVAILGINMEDNSGLGFDGVNISDNLVVNGNSQGVRLEHVFNATVTGNTMVEVGGKAPGILVTHRSHDVEVTGNLAGFVSTDFDGQGNLHDNIIVQNDDPSMGQYYDSKLVAQLQSVSATEAFKFFSELLANTKPLVASAQDMRELSLKGLDTDVGQRISAKGALSQQLVGGRSDDTITGLAGNDTLAGGGGKDYLAGAAGNDALIGGADADKFVFSKTYVSEQGIDTIVDFNRLEGDLINVHSIDANDRLAGDQDFKFIAGDQFHRLAGELRYAVESDHLMIQGDVNGDGLADFSIKALGVNYLKSGDFLL